MSEKHHFVIRVTKNLMAKTWASVSTKPYYQISIFSIIENPLTLQPLNLILNGIQSAHIWVIFRLLELRINSKSMWNQQYLKQVLTTFDKKCPKSIILWYVWQRYSWETSKVFRYKRAVKLNFWIIYFNFKMKQSWKRKR